VPHLTRDDSIFVLHLNDEGASDDENVFGPTQVAKINDLLDEVEASDGPTVPRRCRGRSSRTFRPRW